MTVAHFADARFTFETFTAHEERGWWAGAPSDPNPTFNGVTQHVYSAWRAQHGLLERSVHEMSTAEQAAIYESYWAACAGETVAGYSGALAVCHADAAFNSGGHEAAILLQASVGAAKDGDLGPLTWLAVQRSVENTEAGTIMAYLQNRWSFLQGLKNFEAWKHVWGGRENRLALLCGVPWETP